MQIKYINKTPTVDEFNQLTEAVGGEDVKMLL